MKADHLEILVEEPSAEAFLNCILPRILNDGDTFQIHVHQGKADLLRKLESRIKAYSKWLPDNARIVVLVDRDTGDCKALKRKMEAAAAAAGMTTRSATSDGLWRVVNRIAIEELEAWFFGEWSSVRAAYPNVATNIVGKAAYRLSDQIGGGTWEAFERILQSSGYFHGGLRKVEAATSVGNNFDPNLCISPSFINFRDAILEAVNTPRSG